MDTAPSQERTADAELRAFRRETNLSLQAMCAAIIAGGNHAVQVHNEKLAVDNLARIIEATLELANRKGFSAMSMRDLARKTGLSLGGLYAYFGGKDELVAVIQRQGQAQIEQLLRGRIAAYPGNPRAQLDEAIRSHVLASEVLRPWFVFMYMEARHLGKTERRHAVAMEQVTEAIFAELIDAGRDAGIYRDAEPLVAAAMLKALLQDWYLKRGKHIRRGVTAGAYAHSVQDLMQRYLKPEEAAEP